MALWLFDYAHWWKQVSGNRTKVGNIELCLFLSSIITYHSKFGSYAADLCANILLKTHISGQKMTAYEHHSEPSWKPASLLGGRKWQIYGQINHKEPSGMLNLFWPPQLMKLEQVQLPVQKPKEQSTSSIRHGPSPSFNQIPNICFIAGFCATKCLWWGSRVIGVAIPLDLTGFQDHECEGSFHEVLSRRASDTQTENFLQIFSLQPLKVPQKISKLANAASESACAPFFAGTCTHQIPLICSDSFLFNFGSH